MAIATRRTSAGTAAWRPCAAGLMLAGLLACSAMTDDGELPPDVPDPGTVQTPTGAVEAYRAGIVLFREAVIEVVGDASLLTDELTMLGARLGLSAPGSDLDIRQVPPTAERAALFLALQGVRGQGQQARGLLRDFAPASSPALIGHLYALEGYADIYLADYFCSGIPLSTIDYNADYTLAPGSTTAEVYERALTLFDTALTMSADSVRVLHLAALGRARALLGLGRYADAAAAVSAVPDNYQYQVPLIGETALQLWERVPSFNQGEPIVMTMPDGREGVNGLDFRSSGDPRTTGEAIGENQYGYTFYIPSKYLPVGGPAMLVVASGVEARLIAAEAALAQGGGDWLVSLNALRTTGTFDLQPDPTDPTVTDTVWHAGSGGVPGLRPLEDPGSTDAQVSLLFRERAFWLYLTGHRQGDLRRLIREYGRPQHTVYPIGSNYPGGNGIYGSDVTIPVPESERAFNPAYTGCINRNA